MEPSLQVPYQNQFLEFTQLHEKPQTKKAHASVPLTDIKNEDHLVYENDDEESDDNIDDEDDDENDFIVRDDYGSDGEEARPKSRKKKR